MNLSDGELESLQELLVRFGVTLETLNWSHSSSKVWCVMRILRDYQAYLAKRVGNPEPVRLNDSTQA